MVYDTHTCELEDVPPEECDQCNREAAEAEYGERLQALNEEFGYR